MKEFINKHFQGDHIIWILIGALFIVSTLVVYSATGYLAYKYRDGDTSFYLLRQFKFLSFALIIIYITHKIDYNIFQKLSNILFIVAVILLIVTLGFGVETNDAKRWLTIPILGIEFQTSDFAKFALIVFISKQLAINQDDIEELNKNLFKIFIYIGIICGLIVSENLSTAVLLFLTSVILLFVGRVNIKLLSTYVGGIALAGIIFLAIAFATIDSGRVGTWKNRVYSFFDDSGERDTHQADMAKIAVATGGIFGKGPGMSTQRTNLPQPYADFIYAIIIEEYGMFGAIVPLFIYIALFYRTMKIVEESQRSFQAFLALGLTISIVFQALINMAVAVTLFPVTGQTLPFISMGGTSLLLTGLTFGIVLNISKSTQLVRRRSNRNNLPL